METCQSFKKSFSSEFCEQLKRRILTNQRNRRYLCGVGKCRRKFKEFANLLLHRRSHKPFIENVNVQNKYKKRIYYRQYVNILKWRNKSDPCNYADKRDVVKSRISLSNSERKRDLSEEFMSLAQHKSLLIAKKNGQSESKGPNFPHLSPMVVSHHQEHNSFNDQQSELCFNEQDSPVSHSHDYCNNSTLSYKTYDSNKNKSPGYHKVCLFERKKQKINNDIEIFGNLFPCLYCGALFVTEDLLTEHEAIHRSADEESYHPSTCYQKSYGFDSKLCCDKCHVRFSSMGYFEEHMSLVHQHQQRKSNAEPFGIKITSAFSLQTKFESNGQKPDGKFINHDKSLLEGNDIENMKNGFEIASYYSVSKEGDETGNKIISNSSLGRTPVPNSFQSTNETSIFKCRVCNTEFTKLKDLRSHVKLHDDQGNHQCLICKQRFTRKWNLEAHVRRHTGERPYGCDICGDRFKMRHHLKRHSQTHTKSLKGRT